MTDRRWRDAVLPISETPWGQPAVPIRGALLLLAPRQSYLERWNQLVMDEVEIYGSNLGRPLSILGGRLMRLGVLMRF